MAYKKRKGQADSTLMKRTLTLPPELLIQVFQYLSHSQKALYTLSFVCKQWLHCVTPILYANPRITHTYNWAAFILTLTRKNSSFSYGKMVRTIDLSSGKSLEQMKDHEYLQRITGAEDNNTTIRIRNGHLPYEHDLLKLAPFITLSTSSLIQIAKTCKNLKAINLAYTSLLCDIQIKETGEYVSTLQHYAVPPPGLTLIQVPVEEAIATLGRECKQLRQVHVQRCEWVTTHILWMFVYYCPNLVNLDARRSTKCSVKRLIAGALKYDPPGGGDPELHEFHPEAPEDLEDDDVAFEEQVHEVDTDLNHLTDNETDDNESDDGTTLRFVVNEATGLFQQVQQQQQQQQQQGRRPDTMTRQQRLDFATAAHQPVRRLSAAMFEVEEFHTRHEFHRIIQTLDNMRNRHQTHDMTFEEYMAYHQTRGLTDSMTSLKDIVYAIIIEAKQNGVMDLDWINDYY